MSCITKRSFLIGAVALVTCPQISRTEARATRRSILLGNSASIIPTVFPGDLSSFGGIYGTSPMTRAVWLASFAAPVKVFDYQLWSSSGAGATGSIYFKNGKIVPSDVTSLQGLVSHSSVVNPFYGTSQVRCMKWYDQSGNGYNLAPAAIGSAPVIAVINGRVVLIFGGSQAVSGTPLYVSGPALSSSGFTLSACCRPTYSWNGFGGPVVYSSVPTDTGNGVGLTNLAGSSDQNWGWFNNNVGTTASSALAASNAVSMTFAQSETSNCEVGAGTVSATFAPPYTGSSVSGSGFCVGGGATKYFNGIVTAAMFESVWQAPAKTATYRAAMNYTYGVSAINETKNIVIGGVSTAAGLNGFGAPFVNSSTDNGPLAYGFAQFFMDQIAKNYRLAVVAKTTATDTWTDMTARISNVLDYYSAGNTNIHYIESANLNSETAAAYVTSAQSYCTAFQSAASGRGQTWLIYLNGLTPNVSGNDAANTLIAAGAAGHYTYVPTVSDAAYNTAVATFTGTNEFLYGGHETMTCFNVVAGAGGEGTNFAAAIG